MQQRRITIHFLDDTDQSLVIDRHEGVRMYENEGHTVLHFGRTDDDRWAELVAAPVSSVRSWD